MARRSLRWSAADLERLGAQTVQSTTRATAAATADAASDRRAEHGAGADSTNSRPPLSDATKQRRARIARVIESVSHCTVSGSHRPGQVLELVFDGAELLSPNALLAATPFERIGYRRAWHAAILRAVLVVTGGPRHLQTFTRFHVEASRRAPRLCDPDALAGYFKAPIDGLRYARAIEDDSARHFMPFAPLQSSGPARIELQVRAARC